MSNSNREPALFRRYPGLRDKLAFQPFGNFPTPVEPAVELAKALDVGELIIKRDDISAADYGGNKVRKLEFLLGDAKAKRCSSIVTFGGLGSNHALATAINCKRFGLQCGAVLTPEPVTEAVRNTLAYHVKLGTRIAVADDYPNITEAAGTLKDSFGAEHCYEIPFGGSSWIGALGFVDAALELAEQITAGQLEAPDIIYMACGTTGSVAGLAVGLQLAGLDTRIEAVQVTPDSIQPEKLAIQLSNDLTTNLPELDASIPALEAPMANVNVRNDQLGDGYAMPTAECERAAELFREKVGLPISLTYTAKAMAGLIADAASQDLSDKRVLFWNTYNSQPYPDLGESDWSSLPEELQTLLNQSA